MQKLGINPWITIWTSPRKTIRAIVETNPKKDFLLLAAITFMQAFFLYSGYYTWDIAYGFLLSLAVAIIISPFIGWVWFYTTVL